MVNEMTQKSKVFSFQQFSRSVVIRSKIQLIRRNYFSTVCNRMNASTMRMIVSMGTEAANDEWNYKRDLIIDCRKGKSHLMPIILAHVNGKSNYFYYISVEIFLFAYSLGKVRAIKLMSLLLFHLFFSSTFSDKWIWAGKVFKKNYFFLCENRMNIYTMHCLFLLFFLFMVRA